MKVPPRWAAAWKGGLIGVLIYGAFVAIAAVLVGSGDGDYPNSFYWLAFAVWFIVPAFALGAVCGLIGNSRSN